MMTVSWIVTGTGVLAAAGAAVASVAPLASAAATAAAASRGVVLIRGIFMIAFPLSDVATTTEVSSGRLASGARRSPHPLSPGKTACQAAHGLRISVPE